MEIQLLFEKIIDLQKSYHHQFHELCKTYDDQKNKLKTINEKRIFLRKKIIILLMQKEKKNLKENNNIYMDFRIKKNIANDSSKINKNEISIWNKMFPTKKKITEKKTQKNALKQIFKTIAFDRYKSISHKLNTIEKTIVKRLYKKYHSHNKSHSNNKKKNNINNNNNHNHNSHNNHNHNSHNNHNNKSTKKYNTINTNSSEIKSKSKNTKKLNINKNTVGTNNFKYIIRNKVYS
jgi:hypothetical protein